MRRLVLGMGAALCFFVVGSHESVRALERLKVDFNYVKERARQLSESPHGQAGTDIPEFMRNLDYHAYREIRAENAKGLWADEDLPFRVTFSPPGYIYSYAVTIHEFTATHVQQVPFAPHFFDFGNQQELAARIPPSMGYAGFHVFYPLNRINETEEVAVFLGSNYFRVVGRGTRFGISARGLAIDTTAGEEEFPVFREFWLGKPQREAENLIIYALLDGPSVTGAYRFKIIPGHVTEVDVQMTLYLRKAVRQIGIAPFSSMFYFNENSLHKPPDYRPRVHDSDGLLIRRPDGAYVWQPLINPSDRLVSIFRFDQPVAFGLSQRNRKFANYQDIDQSYQRRPSAWVEPGGDWGPGSVVLYTFGVDSETDDNVVAFWQPREPLPVGTPVSFAYTLMYSLEQRASSGYVTATRVGGPVLRNDLHQYIVDFDGGELRRLEAVDHLQAVVRASNGIRLEKPIVVKNSFQGGWRLITQFSIVDESLQKGRLTAYLTHKGQRMTETWSYVWTKERQFPPIPQQQIYGTKPTGE